MEHRERHEFVADASFDGGDLDCGSGLLLVIRQHMDPLRPGGLLEILSLEPSVEEDLPAWCRLTGNQLVSRSRVGSKQRFLICKGQFDPRQRNHNQLEPGRSPVALPALPVVEVSIPAELPRPAPAPAIAPLSVMGIGSWPRPRWLIRALHDHLEGKLTRREFHEYADDAVRLSVAAQLRAGVDVVTDGEQRRDNYSSFVGNILDNCALIPLVDLLPLVDHPEEFARELDSLDVPSSEVRHPVVFGPLGRSSPLALGEFQFAATLTDKPIKTALPGPYLLARTMWLDCITDKAYDSRESLSRDIARVLREEISFLLAAGVALIQLDEPVLTEVVFGSPVMPRRSFMCGALGDRGGREEELAFAEMLLAQTLEGFPPERMAIHICRGNWSPDESVALSGDYAPLVPLLGRLKVGTAFLEFCTPRAGDLNILTELPEGLRIGLGVVNPKDQQVESVDAIARRAEQAIKLVGENRLLLNPDCGFATFADNPVSSAAGAEAKLAALVRAAGTLRGESTRLSSL